MKKKRKTAKLPKPVRAWAVWNMGTSDIDTDYIGTSRETVQQWASCIGSGRHGSFGAIQVRIVPVAKKRGSKKP